MQIACCECKIWVIKLIIEYDEYYQIFSNKTKKSDAYDPNTTLNVIFVEKECKMLDLVIIVAFGPIVKKMNKLEYL